MSTSPENIFAWRSKLRDKQKRERVDWFYQEKLLPQLAEDVDKADQLVKKKKHQPVIDLFEPWVRTALTGENVVYAKAKQRSESDFSEHQYWVEWVAIGLAGLTLDRHRVMNEQIIPQKHSKDVQAPPAEFATILSIYDQVHVAQLPSQTIHETGIHWLSEVTQENAKTYQKLNNDNFARILLQHAIETISKDIQPLKRFVQVRRARNNKHRTESDKKYITGLSELAELQSQLAYILSSPAEMKLAIQNAEDAFNLDPNQAALAKLSLLQLLQIFTQEQDIENNVKQHTIDQAIRGITQSFRRSPRQTLSTLISMFTR